jgi:hypothetical protein
MMPFYKNFYVKMILYLLGFIIVYLIYKECNPTVEDLIERRNNRDFQSVHILNLWRTSDYYIDWEARCIENNKILDY